MKKLLLFMMFLLLCAPLAFADRVIDGGEGIDTVIYTGERGQYNIKITGGFITIDGKQGKDTISNVEYIQFDDMIIRTSDLLPVPVIEIPTHVQLNEGEYVEVLMLPSYRVLSGDFLVQYETKGIGGINDKNKAELARDFKENRGHFVIDKNYEPIPVRTETIDDSKVEELEYYVLSLSGDDVVFIQGGETKYTPEIVIEIIDNHEEEKNKLEKKSKAVLYKNRILTKKTLQENIIGYKGYISAFDDFLEKNNGNLEKLIAVNQRIEAALPKLGKSETEQKYFYILSYLQAVIELEMYSTK